MFVSVCHCACMRVTVCAYNDVSDIADTLRYLLAGSGEITLENIEVNVHTTCMSISVV